jgi:hypothetical protein
MILFFGLKTIVKTDPTPKPTKKKVMAECTSYSLFFARSISPRALAKYEAASIGVQEACHLSKAICFQTYTWFAEIATRATSTSLNGKSTRCRGLANFGADSRSGKDDKDDKDKDDKDKDKDQDP